MDFGPSGGQVHQEISVEIGRRRLCELFGTAALPEPIERAGGGGEAYPGAALPPGPSLLGLVDDVLRCDVRGPARQLYLQAKSLEILAGVVDALVDDGRAAATPLSPHDVDRVELARRLLLERLESPPTLAELSARTGLSPTRLKHAFHRHVGSPVFTYLRECRLDEAHRLLRAGTLGVTQVSARVGYANPSKFAAAFRRRFGVSPSQVRR
jgi:AraC-like DNA-binding protein